MSTPSEARKLIFDCHLDISMNAMEFNRDQRWTQEKIRRSELSDPFILPGAERHRARNTVCFPELRRGRIGVIVATQIGRYSPRFHNLPGWRSPEQAWAQTQGQLAYYRIMEECGEMVQLRTWADVENHASKWIAASDAQAATLPIGYLLSLKGADSILSWRHLERSRAEGLIALGPVHYGPGIYGCGTDDEGPLTAKGRELLKEMERLGIILDVTHLCDESMRDSLDHFSGPLWASHHNCRALANWNRQLTDEQIMELVQRGAVIGMAFDAIMMVHGWHHKVFKPQDFGLRIEKSASTLTTSASSPTTRATSASALISTAATAPSRRLSISTASPTSRSSTISSRSAAIPPPTSPEFSAGTSSASCART